MDRTLSSPPIPVIPLVIYVILMQSLMCINDLSNRCCYNVYPYNTLGANNGIVPMWLGGMNRFSQPPLHCRNAVRADRR